MEKVIVTQAVMADLDRIAPLFDAYRVFYRQPTDLESARRFILERLSGSESIIFLASDADSGMDWGFTQLYPLFSSVRMSRAWLLNDLFVVPDGRRRGVAQLLMEAATDFARSTGAAIIQLETEVSNAPAQALYEKEGWARETSSTHYSLTL